MHINEWHEQAQHSVSMSWFRATVGSSGGWRERYKIQFELEWDCHAAFSDVKHCGQTCLVDPATRSVISTHT